MIAIKFNLIDWWAKEQREMAPFHTMIAFILGMMVTFVFGLLFEYYPQHDALLRFSMVVLFFATLPVLYVMGEAFKRSAKQDEYQDLLTKCIQNITARKMNMQPGEKYLIAEGICRDSANVLRTIMQLEKILGPEYEIWSAHSPCHESSPYKISIKIQNKPN